MFHPAHRLFFSSEMQFLVTMYWEMWSGHFLSSRTPPWDDYLIKELSTWCAFPAPVHHTFPSDLGQSLRSQDESVSGWRDDRLSSRRETLSSLTQGRETHDNRLPPVFWIPMVLHRAWWGMITSFQLGRYFFEPPFLWQSYNGPHSCVGVLDFTDSPWQSQV